LSMPPPPPRSHSGSGPATAKYSAPLPSRKNSGNTRSFLRPISSSCAAGGVIGGVELSSAWKLVPSSSRPGKLSYLHKASGLKQTNKPTREPTAKEIELHQKNIEHRRRVKLEGRRPGGLPGGVPKRRAVMPLFKSSQAPWFPIGTPIS
jgi:hypothetical protein